ncbi:ATP-binding protein [Aliikangiella sp. IMCC44653]
MIFKNASIKTKITTAVLTISAFCLILALSVFVYINHKDEQQTAINNVSVLAKLVGDRSEAALTFNDKNLAIENLSSLSLYPGIFYACLYDQEYQLFAEYIRNESRQQGCKESLSPTTKNLISNQITVVEQIKLSDEVIGSVLINASLQLVEEHLSRYLLIALVTGVAITVFAFIFATSLTRLLSRPLLELSSVAKEVSENKDYTIRAKKFGKDEIGALVDSFNNMLTTIDEQNRVLLDTTQKANQANEIKSQFLANMSHELRTPINGVLGMNDLLMGTNLTAEQMEYAQLTTQCSNVLLDTVNQILDLASIESVGLNLKNEAVDMLPYIDDIAQLFSAQIANMKLELNINIDKSLPQKLIFDPFRLRQVFINLITNAIKFTKKGGAEVRIGFYQNRLKVSIEDTGIGVPEEARERVFESFQQVDNSSTRPFGGTGLGLSICKEICSAMSGKISVTAAQKGGSIFSFEVEAMQAAYETIQEPDLFDKKRILIVSDESLVSHWFESIAVDYGSEYTLVKSNAFREMELSAYDCILVDSNTSLVCFTNLLRSIGDLPCQIIWYTWFGEDLPAEYKNKAITIYKPATLLSLIELSEVPVSSAGRKLSQRQKYRLLLAEDNEINRKTFQLQLHKAGFRIDCVSNGQEALEAVLSESYDLILMDVQMPVLDGISASKAINAELADKAPTIIGLSAHVMQDQIDSALSAGMKDYLCKPIKERDLISKLDSLLHI